MKSKIAGNLHITPINDDDSFKDVWNLFVDVYRSLESGGKFVLTFRDLIFELKDRERFILVKSDPKIIFTCILEYETEHVKVNDMIYTKDHDMWKLDVSSYIKLRIPQEWVGRELLGLGFSMDLCKKDKGMITVIASK